MEGCTHTSLQFLELFRERLELFLSVRHDGYRAFLRFFLLCAR